jgi:flagellar protein FlbD
MYLNPHLIKEVESIPDTIVTLSTGDKLYVKESAFEVSSRFVDYQRLIRFKFEVMHQYTKKEEPQQNSEPIDR